MRQLYLNMRQCLCLSRKDCTKTVNHEYKLSTGEWEVLTPYELNLSLVSKRLYHIIKPPTDVVLFCEEARFAVDVYIHIYISCVYT